MKLRTLLACAAALAGVTLVGMAPGAAASQGTVTIRLVEVPSDQAGDPRSHFYIVDQVGAGGSLERTVEIRNRSEGPVTVALYAAGADVVDGAFTFAPGRTQNELSSWTTVAPPQLRLEPGAAGTATVIIDVPGSASGGEHYGVVWAEMRPEGQGSVATINRVGVRMYVTAGGAPVTSDFEVRSLEAIRDDRGPAVAVGVANTGDTAVDLGGEIMLTDGPGGASAGPFTIGAGTTLAPGTAGSVYAALPADVPAGPWTVTAVVRSGALERRGAATLSFSAERARSGAVATDTEAARAQAAPRPERAASAAQPAAVAAGALAGASALGGSAMIVRARLLRRRGL